MKRDEVSGADGKIEDVPTCTACESWTYSSWEKDGQKHSKLEVIAEEVVPLQAMRQDDVAAGAADSEPRVYDEDVSF